MEERTKVVEIDGAAMERLADDAKGGDFIILTRDGRPVAAVIDIDALKELTDEREMLRRLALGELESAAGEGDELETVLEDCRLLLEEN